MEKNRSREEMGQLEGREVGKDETENNLVYEGEGEHMRVGDSEYMNNVRDGASERVQLMKESRKSVQSY